MNNPVYCDGIESISIAQGMVRLELFTYGRTEKGKEPERVRSAQVVMPPQGFLQAFNGMAQLMKQLESQGLVKRGPGAGEARP